MTNTPPAAQPSTTTNGAGEPTEPCSYNPDWCKHHGEHLGCCLSEDIVPTSDKGDDQLAACLFQVDEPTVPPVVSLLLGEWTEVDAPELRQIVASYRDHLVRLEQMADQLDAIRAQHRKLVSCP
jgi:hypothetical protein